MKVKSTTTSRPATRRKSWVRMPVEAFKICPQCQARVIAGSAEDVYCTMCGWDSSSGFIGAGGWDEFFSGLNCDLVEAYERLNLGALPEKTAFAQA